LEDLPRLFDPHAAPATWLPWLSGWLTFILDEHWAEADARANLAGAFRLYSKRGTIEGLREYLRIYAGVNAIIEEPAAGCEHLAAWRPEPAGFWDDARARAARGRRAGNDGDGGSIASDHGPGFRHGAVRRCRAPFLRQCLCAELTSTGHA